MKILGVITGVAVGLLAMAAIKWMFDDGSYQCQKRYYQMQSVLKCMQEYPRCEVTTKDFEKGRWSSDYYERNCHDYEQRRPKPQPRAEPQKQSFKTEGNLNASLVDTRYSD